MKQEAGKAQTPRSAGGCENEDLSIYIKAADSARSHQTKWRSPTSHNTGPLPRARYHLGYLLEGKGSAFVNYYNSYNINP